MYDLDAKRTQNHLAPVRHSHKVLVDLYDTIPIHFDQLVSINVYRPIGV